MPTKKKASSTTSKKETSTKKTAAVKKTAAKKPAVKKKVEKSRAVAKKKPVAKKSLTTTTQPAAVKKEVAKVRREVAEAIAQAPVVTMTEERIEHAHKPTEVHRRIVFVGTCSNCDHVPMRVNRLLAMFSVIIFVLSAMVLLNSSGLGLPSIEFAGDVAPIEIRFQRLN